MNNQWQKFLHDNNAQITDGIVQHFDDALAEIENANNHSVISDMSRNCYIEVTGDDTVSFLQGQLSNDISHVDDTHSQISSYSTPKGRMLGIFRIFRFDGKLYLLTSSDLKDNLLKRLRMFVMMAKITFTDVSDQMVCFIGAGGLLKQNADTNEVNQHKQYCTIRTQAGLVYFGTVEALTAQWQALTALGFKPVGDNAGHLLAIKNAIPAVYSQSVEAFIPQHTNLDNLDAINFKKGCYTGQEIIARLHYLGKQKRKMYLCSVTTKTAPKIKDALYKTDEKSKQGSGNIVDVAWLGKDDYLFLAVLQIASIDTDMFVNEVNGDKIKVEQQPYAVAKEA